LTVLLLRARRVFTALWRPIEDSTARLRRDNLTSGLILCNLIFCGIAGACWALNVQKGVAAWPYISFYIGEVILIVMYCGNAWYSRTIARGVAQALDTRPHVSATVPDDDDPAPTPDDTPPPTDDPQPTQGLSIPLQAIGTLNAALVGFLTYYTGGPSNSPYAQVLVAMLLIAEQTRIVKNPDHEDRFWRIIVVSVKEFGWFFVLVAGFYTPLGILQLQYPVKIPTAPVGITIGITAIIFLVGSVTNYLSGSSRGRLFW
jgi:hypothetical protein